MKDKQIDEMFERSASPPVDAALLERVAKSMASTLKPVRPIAPSWMRVSALLLIAAVVAVACASLIGFYGVRKLSGDASGSIFGVLGVFTWLAATTSVREMTPGRGSSLGSAPLLLIVMLGWLAVGGLLFHDYGMGAFVPEGIACLRAGFLAAIPVGGASWIVLRRGFAVDAASAGLAAGTFAGLAGLAMLELHCPNFLAPHIMVWHTAVIPVCALAGITLAWARTAARRS